jgi:hypothetical protein
MKKGKRIVIMLAAIAASTPEQTFRELAEVVDTSILLHNKNTGAIFRLQKKWPRGSFCTGETGDYRRRTLRGCNGSLRLRSHSFAGNGDGKHDRLRRL